MAMEQPATWAMCRDSLPRGMRADWELAHDQIVVQRIPIGRTVNVVPPARHGDDTIILLVVEEVLVVERQLVLEEAGHPQRVRTRQRHVETLVLREPACRSRELSVPAQ